MRKFLDIKVMPLYLIDYIFIISLYITSAFWVAVLIEGCILRPFNPDKDEKKSSIRLFIEIFLQVSLQGFIVIVVQVLLSFIPSPFEFLEGYKNSPEWNIIRNPAIMTAILLLFSPSVLGKGTILFNRFACHSNKVD